MSTDHSGSVEDSSCDANERRTRATHGPMTIEQVYLSHDLISEETDTITTDHVYLERGLVAKTIEANTYYYFTDALGSVRQIWQYGSSNSAKFSVQTYRPFGTPVGVGGTDQKWKYAGEMLDSSTGLYYIGARYMDPELGRWSSLDPVLGNLSSPQTLNRYAYCVNNPLRVTDPTGKVVPLIVLGLLIIATEAGSIGMIYGHFEYYEHIRESGEEFDQWRFFKFIVGRGIEGAAYPFGALGSNLPYVGSLVGPFLQEYFFNPIDKWIYSHEPGYFNPQYGPARIGDEPMRPGESRFIHDIDEAISWLWEQSEEFFQSRGESESKYVQFHFRG